MGDAVQPGGKRHALPFIRRDRFENVEKDLLCHILCLCPVTYLENNIAINPIKVLFIYLS
jgi:hypothetical protein